MKQLAHFYDETLEHIPDALFHYLDASVDLINLIVIIMIMLFIYELLVHGFDTIR